MSSYVIVLMSCPHISHSFQTVCVWKPGQGGPWVSLGVSFGHSVRPLWIGLWKDTLDMGE